MRQEALVNPKLLIWARESINMDIEEAARKIHVKSERLRDWESGEKRPTIRQARDMARVYRRPLASLYLPERPSGLGFSVPHDFRRLPEDQPKDLSPALIAELRRVEYLRDAAVELADEAAEEAAGFVGQTEINEPVQEVAKRVIELLGLPVGARQNWRNDYDALNGWKNAIEQQGVLVMHLNRVEIREVRGIAIADRSFPLIALNGKDSPNGRVFTLLHEFIHLMIGATGMSNMQISKRARSPEQKIERFCNYTAGEALVPRRELLVHADVRKATKLTDWSDNVIERLARHFGVSREVVVRRLLILGKTNEEFYRSKRQAYAKERRLRGELSTGPIPMSRRIIRAIGQPFARIALNAYYQETISGSELAELLGARLKHLPAVEELLAGRNVLA